MSLRFALRYSLTIGSLLLGSAATLYGQQTTPIDASVGVLILAHGADSAWNAPIEALAQQVKRAGVVRGPVGVTFLMGPAAATHRFQDQVAELKKQGAQRIVLVPMLVSSYSGHFDQLRYLAGTLDTLDPEMAHHLRMGGLEPVKSVPMIVANGLDDSPELARILAERARALAPRDRAHRALFLMGHGPNSAEEYATWMKNLRVVADSVRAATGFASVAVELVRDDAPAGVRAEAVKRSREIIALQHAATNKDVVVVPILVSAGDISQRKLPTDLAGLPITYSGEPLLPSPELVHWVERRTRDAVSTHPTSVSVTP
ncbi:MAG TPA: CbiX/SirB N-terminal domain-containing protein [Gemmatimonadaceae bacterium]|jgi:sirohydrochlorin ferrochelatase